MRWLLALAFVFQIRLGAETAADIARAIRESSFDRDECYRVRDLTLVKEDLRLYLTEGHLIFSKPVAGRRIAAVFTADVEGGDGEVILLPPDRAERRSLAAYIDSPNLDEHFRTALLLFTGDDYDRLKAQFPNNPANQRAPEQGPAMDEEWTPVLHNIGVSYATRLTLDLLNGPGHGAGLFAGLFSSPKLGNFDISFDPMTNEQMVAGQVTSRNNRAYFDIWTSFVARSFRTNQTVRRDDLMLRDYRIEATVNPDLSMSVVTRVKVRPSVDGAAVETFDISPQMAVTEVTVDGRAAEVLQRDSLRLSLTRGGNNLFLVVPPEPLRAGREYEFEFHHSGTVIYDAGDRVLYVSARGTWYPLHGTQFCDYDLQFRYPKDLDLVTPGDVVEDRTEGDWRFTRRRTASAIRIAAFNLGNYQHARVERGKYVVDVCANKALERALRPRPQTVTTILPPGLRPRRVPDPLGETQVIVPPPDPMARLQSLASEVASAMEFMASKFGPPTLAHLTVSPIPGTFGQGFPGLVYLSTLAYLKNVPGPRFESGESQELFFQDVLQAHETAHQWWGNRVTASSYRDYWLMEALANYSALLYLEKSKGGHDADEMLDAYRKELLAKSESGQTVDSNGPIVLGMRLENSQEPRAWRTITYGKGSWIIQMLRQRMGDERFFSMLAEMTKRYDGKPITTEAFRGLAAEFLPPKSGDPKLEAFFEQWVYGTGIPTLKLTYSIRGKAPALKLVGTLTQSDVDDDFTTLAPVEIQIARGRSITQWVASASTPVSFTVPLKQMPLKVTLDPHHGVLRR
jgi:hypothetical protein